MNQSLNFQEAEMNVKIEKWFELLKKHGLETIPFHGICPDGSCTCGLNACLNKGDHPLGGFSLEMFDEGRWPYTNIAIDASERIAVLEVTAKGRDPWAKLREEHDIQKTWVASSNGSWLVFFRRPMNLLSVRPWGEGMAIRRDPILVAPSLRPDGKRLQWIVAPWECKLSPIPESLLSICTSKGGAKAPSLKDHSATRSFIRKMWWSQNGNLSNEERRIFVLAKAEEFNKNSLPPLTSEVVHEVVRSTLQVLEDHTRGLGPVPKEVNEVVSLFGPGTEVVDHLSYRE